MKDVFVRTIPMPLSVRAFTIPDAQGDYNIYLNSLLPEEQQQLSYAHEKRHIDNGDFFRELPATLIEKLM